MDVFNYVEIVFKSFPDRTSISVLIAFVFLLILFFLYGILLYKRLDFALRDKRNTNWISVINDLLTVFLNSTDDPDISNPIETILPEIKKIPLNRYFLRKMFCQQILTYHSNFTGNTSDQLKELFLRLHLESILKQKLKSWRRENIIQGIREIAQMQLHQLSPEILKLSKHKSQAISIEAQTAHIILNKGEGFVFLSEMDKPILNWYQLILIDLASHINPSQLPDFSNWLASTNPSVVKLCIKLIGRFQQFHAAEKLISLLNHPDEEIQLLAIKVLGEFEVHEAEDVLLTLYTESSKEIKLEIIKALGRICSDKQLEFLFSKASSDQFRIAFQAVTALKNHGNAGLVQIRKLYTQAPQMNKEIIDHLMGSQLAS